MSFYTKEEIEKMDDIDFLNEAFESLNYNLSNFKYSKKEITTAWGNIKIGLFNDVSINRKDVEIIEYIFSLIRVVDYWDENTKKKMWVSTGIIKKKMENKLNKLKGE